MPDTCLTGNRCYRTKRDANRVLGGIRRSTKRLRRNGRLRLEDHPVWCPCCLRWHLIWSGRRP